jgi:hypothetical protein
VSKKKPVSRSELEYRMHHSWLRRMMNAGKDRGWLYFRPNTIQPLERVAAKMAILANNRYPAEEHRHSLAFKNGYGPGKVIPKPVYKTETENAILL